MLKVKCCSIIRVQLFTTIKKHEIVLKKLRGFIKTLLQVATMYTADEFPDIADNDINIKFDDSVFEDKETEMARDRTNVASWVDVSC